MIDILLHCAAIVLLTVISYSLGSPLTTSWIFPTIILFVRELTQKQAKHGNDFLSGWGEVNHVEWLVPAGLSFILTITLFITKILPMYAW